MGHVVEKQVEKMMLELLIGEWKLEPKAEYVEELTQLASKVHFA